MANGIKKVAFIVKNVLVDPAVRLILFACITMQVLIGCWSFYTSFHHSEWSNIYNVVGSITNYVTKVFECGIGFILLSELIVKSTSFLGGPPAEKSTLFNDFGFKSKWIGFGIFYFVVCNIQDESAAVNILKPINGIEKKIDKPIKTIAVARYILFVAGILSILLGWIGDKLCSIGHLFERKRRVGSSEEKEYKKWVNVKSNCNKLFIFFHFFIFAIFPIVVIVSNILFLYLDFKDYDVSNLNARQKLEKILRDTEGYNVMNALPHICIAIVTLHRIVINFWYKPYKPTGNIWLLTYFYLICGVKARRNYYQKHIKLAGWDIEEVLLNNVYLGVFIASLTLPIFIWFVYITFGKIDRADKVHASGTDTNANLVLIKSVFKRIWNPFTILFNKFILNPKSWYTFIYTMAVILGLGGGIVTTASQAYEKVSIQFDEPPAFKSIIADFKQVKDQITTVTNGFIIVAANLNPCISYNDKSTSKQSINDLIEGQVTKAGNGPAGIFPSSSNTTIKQIYEASNNDTFKQLCFMMNGEVWSGKEEDADCKNVKLLGRIKFKMSDVANRTPTATAPDCSTQEKCLQSSNRNIPEYKLTIDRTCEDVTCVLFIAGLVSAFAASFIPFVGPAISKGLQMTLRTRKTLKKFGRVFKRVAQQVRAKKKKIINLYKTFKSITGSKGLNVKTGYQFYYFLAPALLLTLIAIGLGFFKRKRSLAGGKLGFTAVFTLIGGICFVFAYLSYIFEEVITDMLVEPFKGISLISIKTDVGLDMIIWGYAMSTASTLLFILATLYSNIANYVFGAKFDAAEDQRQQEQENQEQAEEEIKREVDVRRIKKKVPKRKEGSEFAGWLFAFIITLPIYYFIFISYSNNDTILHAKLTPSENLEKVRVTFGHTSALERELGSIDDLNMDNNNICDIISGLVKDIINNMKFPLPNIGTISELFKMNINIRKHVMAVIKQVSEAISLNINGFNLFEGIKFAKITLQYAPWQMIIVFGLPFSLVIAISLCTLFTFLQQLGCFDHNRVNDYVLPFVDRMIIPISCSSFSNQLAIVGIFSFLDGFETPMFTFSIEVGKMITYGILCSVFCLVASILKVMTQFVPIDDGIENSNMEGYEQLP